MPIPFNTKCLVCDKSVGPGQLLLIGVIGTVDDFGGELGIDTDHPAPNVAIHRNCIPYKKTHPNYIPQKKTRPFTMRSITKQEVNEEQLTVTLTLDCSHVVTLVGTKLVSEGVPVYCAQCRS